MLKEHFPDRQYGLPASVGALAEAEAKLGVRFPNEL
ncbi:cell wall assembly regulator SMI1 [Variovorax boronicumulans]|uniref:Cell wall assembly regulator SMI1 n=1 Tax=Variovorax boronicumulans TaxID=436515 RepID=A0AAW8DQR1_9BURK|nr:cell wall assembly regulator SMI1 [Variovorax boronicumulans]MDP9921836.1 cell wall assembly regulator SMI1 [Variovorax boronicumulans]